MATKQDSAREMIKRRENAAATDERFVGGPMHAELAAIEASNDEDDWLRATREFARRRHANREARDLARRQRLQQQAVWLAVAVAVIIGAALWLRSADKIPAAPAAVATAPIAGQPAADAAPVTARAPVAAITPAPTNAADNAAATRARITTTVNAWAAAWSRQDVAAYLGVYAHDYTPSRDLSHDQWRAERSARLAAPAAIEIQLSGLQIALGEDGTARARFLQSYRSPTYSDQVVKTLTLENRQGNWLIIAERSALPTG